MHIDDCHLIILVLLALVVWGRVDAWRERRRAGEYRRAMAAMAALMKEGRRHDG